MFVGYRSRDIAYQNAGVAATFCFFAERFAMYGIFKGGLNCILRVLQERHCFLLDKGYLNGIRKVENQSLFPIFHEVIHTFFTKIGMVYIPR